MKAQSLIRVKEEHEEEAEGAKPCLCPTEAVSANLLKSFVAEDVSSHLYDVERSSAYVTIAS